MAAAHQARVPVAGLVILLVVATLALAYGIAVTLDYRGFAQSIYSRLSALAYNYPFLGPRFEQFYPYGMFRISGPISIAVAVIAYVIIANAA